MSKSYKLDNFVKGRALFSGTDGIPVYVSLADTDGYTVGVRLLISPDNEGMGLRMVFRVRLVAKKKYPKVLKSDLISHKKTGKTHRSFMITSKGIAPCNPSEKVVKLDDIVATIRGLAIELDKVLAEVDGYNSLTFDECVSLGRWASSALTDSGIVVKDDYAKSDPKDLSDATEIYHSVMSKIIKGYDPK